MLRHLPVLAVAVVLLSGCGSGGDTGQAPPEPRGVSSAGLRDQLAKATAVRAADFPAPGGKTIQELADSLYGTGPQVAFATASLVRGERQRLAFGLIDNDQNFIYAPTAVYLARGGSDAPAIGPFVAPADLLVTDEPFRSQTAASESSPFAAIYSARADFPEAGTYAVLTVSKIDGNDVGAGSMIKVKTPAADTIPDVGERAPVVATETRASAGGDIKSIDTRVPPDSMHDVDFRDVAGKKPTILLFATPQLCESRVCGPVVDIAEQLKRTYGDRVAFIHQEVFVDNEIAKGLRPPLEAFNLQTEPWLFAVDKTGRVTTRLEGSFGFDAVDAAIKSALG